MIIPESFSEAFCNAEIKVLGRVLRPFSLRHLRWLYALESPFARLLNGEKVESLDVSFHHLRVFVAICASRSDREVMRNLKSGRLRRAGRLQWTRARAWAKVVVYIRDFISVPEVISTTGGEGGDTLGSPWIVRLVVKLCRSRIGDVETVWNLPIGQALWYSAVASELEGQMVLGDAEYEQFIKEVRESNPD